MRALMFYGMSEKKDKSCSIKISRSFNITPPSQAWNPPFFFNPNSRAIGHTFMSLTSWKMTGDLYRSFYLDCLMLPMSNLDHLIVWSQLSVEKAVYIYICIVQHCHDQTYTVVHFISTIDGKKDVCIIFSWLFHIFRVKLGPVSLWFSCQWQESCMHQYIQTAQHCLCETWTFDHLISNSHWQPLISQVGWWIKLNFGIWHIPATMETILCVLVRVT